MGQIDFRSEYLAWLKENIEQHKISDSTYRITLPFLDRHNDLIEVYIIKQGNENQYKITDDAYTISDLELSGFDVKTSDRRRQLLDQILNSHGITMDSDGALVVEATSTDIPLKKHMLTQAIQKISDLFYLARSNVRSIFLEDVQAFLDEKEIRYTPSPTFLGRSKLPTNYDFVIPKSKTAPERIIKVTRSLTIDNVKSIIFSWEDISGMRADGTKLYTFFEDPENNNPSKAINALSEYHIVPVPWSKREDYALKLVE